MPDIRKKEFSEVKPYTYTITRKSDGLNYHGVRFGNVKSGFCPSSDIGIRYFTSGIFKKEFRKVPTNFIIKLRWTFGDIFSALDYEAKVNIRLIHRPNWVNAAVGKGCSDIEKLKRRREESCMRKHGVPHNMMVKSIRDKRDVTVFNIYGVKNVGESILIRRKVVQTSIEKFGVECSFQSADVKEKIKKSLVEKYGVDNPLKSEVVMNKMKKNSTEKYGCEYSFERKDVIEKIHGKRKEMYIKLAEMNEETFSRYLLNISQHKAVQNQKKTQRLKGQQLLKEIINA